MPSLSSACVAAGLKTIGSADRVIEMDRGDIDGERHVAPGLEAAGARWHRRRSRTPVRCREAADHNPPRLRPGPTRSPVLEDRARRRDRRATVISRASLYRCRTDRDDQDILDVEVAAGVQATRDHVDHRQRQGRLRRQTDSHPACCKLDRARADSDERTAPRRVPRRRAWATASETPSRALAPSRLLFGVPSSAISLASSAA